MNKEQVLKAIKGTGFEADLSVGLNVQGQLSSRGWYNLVVTMRDLKLYSKGIKPHRFWKITNVKNYFGIKGTASDMLVTLETYKKALFD